MAAGFAVGVDGDPIRVGAMDGPVGGVGVGTAHDIHAEFPAAGDEFTEGVSIAEELAAVMERNWSGVVGDAATGGEAGGAGMSALEVVEPEGGIVVARIVFDEGKLSPAHGTSVPAGRGGRGR